MTNAELIATLRCCGKKGGCLDCPLLWKPSDACFQLAADAADLIEAQQKQIAELEAQLPKEGEWIEGTYNLAHNLYTCSVCGLAMITTPDYAEKHHYCYGCGAKNKVKWMKGEQE